MATGDIKIGIDIVSNAKEETKDAIKLKQAYEGAQKAASNMGGTAGSRAVAAKAAPASSGGLSGKDYGTAQGTSGMGSSARDFAKEAQGLGGLVRVYATFAANLFAVSAAFTALRDAASTENIVKGLDQLGAASGRSLGNLSKQLVAASDGAISLRDSMTAVAQASSGGLSNKQILQLGEVAKKTSEALGLSMPDAISRLSRGITKIEPELLDELGIFVKVNDASNTYALSIGKSAASLSDFEKRQAFANAVLDQGIKKFADIKIDANPYDKLLASMSNVATTGLQLVNKVLGPIASVLAESPGALAGVFGLIAVTLLRQAIPALSQWRSELTKAAETSAASAKRSYESFRDYSISKALESEATKVGPINQKINDKIAEAQTALAKTLSSKSKILAQAMSGTADPEVMQKSLETEQKRRETALATLEAQKQASIATGTATAAQIAAYDTLAQKEHEKLIGIKTGIKAYADVAEEQKKINKIQSETEKPGLEEKVRKTLAERAQSIAISKGILAQVGSDTEAKGMGKAFTYLFDNIKNGVPIFDEFGKVIKDQDGNIARASKGLTGFRAATTALSGSFLIVGDAIGKGLSAISPYLQLIGLLITAYELFDSWASKAAKEQIEFNTKISEGESAVKTVTNTFDAYVRKTKDAFTIQGISAFTTALAGVSDSLDSQLLAYDKYKQVAGTFDKLKDSMAGFFFFTESNLEKLQKSTVESVQGVVKSLELSGKSDTQKGIIAEALFGKDASIDKLYGSTKDLNKAFDGLSGSEREEKIKRVAKAVDLVTQSEQYSTNAAIAFKESLSSIDKIVDQIIQANAFSDLQGKLGVDLVLAAERLSQALADPVKGLVAIANLTKDPKAFAALGSVDITQLQQAVALEKQLNDAQKARADALDQKKKAEAGSGKRVTSINEQSGFSFGDLGGTSAGDVLAKMGAKKLDIEEANKKVKETSDNFDKLKKEATEFSVSQISLVTKIADAGFAKIEIGLKKAKEQADLSVAKTAANISASGGANVADRNYAIRVSELKIQQTLIDANYAVQLASMENSQKLDELNTTMQLATSAEMKKSNDPTVRDAGTRSYDEAVRRSQIIRLAELLKNPIGNAKAISLVTAAAPANATAAAQSRNDQLRIPKMQAKAAGEAVRGQLEEVILTRDAERRSEALRSTKEGLDLDNQRLNTQNEGLNLASKILGYDTASLVQEKQNVQQKLISNDTAAKLAEIEKDRQNSLVDAGKEDIKQINLRAQSRSKEVKDAAEAKKYTDDIVGLQQLGAATQADITRESAKTLEKLRLNNSIEETRLSNLQAELGFKQQLGLIDERSANAQKAAYELQALQQKSVEEEAKLQADIDLKKSALDIAKAITRSTREGPTDAGLAAATNENNAQTALNAANAQLAALKERTKIQETGIEQAKTYNDLLIDQKQNQDNLNSTTKMLVVILGDVGQNLGDTISGFSNLLLNNKKRAAQEAEAAKTGKNLAKLKEQNTKDELSDISSVAGATKKLFDEKSAGYKILGKVEQGAAIARLALEANTALQSIGINIPAIYAQFMAALGPFGPPAAAAAIAAFVGSAFTGGGGEAPAFDYGTYKKDQGTYIDSSTPQNTGLKDSLDTLVNISRPELPLTAKMARHLESIDGKTQTFAQYQLNNIGTATNNIPSTYNKTSPNGLLSMGVGAALGAGFGAATAALASFTANAAGSAFVLGNFGVAISDAASSAAAALFNLSDFFLPGAGILLGAVLGTTPAVKHLTEVLITGSDSISQGLQGMGFEISQQTLAMAGSTLAINDYADVLTTRSHSAGALEKVGSWIGLGGGDSTSTVVDTITGKTDPAIKKAFEDMFSTIQDTVVLGAKALKIPMKDLIVPYKKLEIVANDTKGNLERVNTYFSEITDNFVTQLIPDIQRYTVGSEKATQTFYRLAGAQEEANYYTEKLGLSTVSYAEIVNTHGDASAEILRTAIIKSDIATTGIKDIIESYTGKASDMAAVYTTLMDIQLGLIALGGSSKSVNADLVKGAGGVEALSSSWSSFQNTFLTVGEQKFQQQVKMDAAFKKLGLETPKTAQGFKDLVLGLMQGGEATSETLGSVLSLTDGMRDLVGSIDDISTSLKSTISNFTTFLDSVKTFRQGMVLSANSVGTAGEKLAIAKTDFNDTAAKAVAGDIKAQGRLTNVAQTVLDLGKTLYASSPEYVSLYNEISTTLQTVESNASQTIDTATLQLNQATSQTGYLSSIDTNIKNFLDGVNNSGTKTIPTQPTRATAQSVQVADTTDNTVKDDTTGWEKILKAIQKAVPNLFHQHAKGGLAQGLSLVGERGPELVDFTMPGQVYTADQTRGMFAGANGNMSAGISNMISEIKQLREEVSQLRKDQQKQTGDIIISNYDANEKASTQVADAVAQTSNDAQWAVRSMPVIK